jgi:hypothetical protein
VDDSSTFGEMSFSPSNEWMCLPPLLSCMSEHYAVPGTRIARPNRRM